MSTLDSEGRRWGAVEWLAAAPCLFEIKYLLKDFSNPSMILNRSG